MLSNGWNGKFYGLCILAQSHKINRGLPNFVTTSTHIHVSLESFGARKAGSVVYLGWCSQRAGFAKGSEAKGNENKILGRHRSWQRILDLLYRCVGLRDCVVQASEGTVRARLDLAEVGVSKTESEGGGSQLWITVRGRSSMSSPRGGVCFICVTPLPSVKWVCFAHCLRVQSINGGEGMAVGVVPGCSSGNSPSTGWNTEERKNRKFQEPLPPARHPPPPPPKGSPAS